MCPVLPILPAIIFKQLPSSPFFHHHRCWALPLSATRCEAGPREDWRPCWSHWGRQRSPYTGTCRNRCTCLISDYEPHTLFPKAGRLAGSFLPKLVLRVFAKRGILLGKNVFIGAVICRDARQTRCRRGLLGCIDFALIPYPGTSE